jgi:DNA-binding beta-propeller fold protein YncE
VAFDRQGDLFVSDTGNNRILKYSRDGVIVDRFGHTGSGKGEFLHPAGLAVGGDGSLYVADTGNNRVQRLSAHGHPLGTWRSSGTGHLSNPEGLAIDQEGRLYVVDRSNARIEVMNVRRRAGHPGRLTTLTLPSGWALNQPKGIAVDRRERVYVADSGNRRVLVLSGSKRMKVRGIAGPPGHRSFDPTGIAVSHAGGVYVTDTLGSCVDSADAGHLSPSHWQMICSHLHAPQGIAEDGRNHIFIADSGDSRILMLSAGTGGQYGG